MRVGIAHHFKAVEIDVIQAAVGEAAQDDIVKAVGGANLVAVNPGGIAHGLADADRALFFKLLAGDNGHRLRRLNIRRGNFGRAALHLRSDHDGFVFSCFLGQQGESDAAGHPSHQQRQASFRKHEHLQRHF